MDSAYLFGYLIGGLIGAVIWGFVAKMINESKGYDGGFAWGFWLGIIGVIVVAVKPENRSYSSYPSTYDSALSSLAKESQNHKLLREGGWKCDTCGAVNPSYVTTCPCGISAADNKRKIAERRAAAETPKLSASDEIAKYKQLLDNGAITEEEFAAKKKQILGL